jgi:uncharacterized membrane protein
MDLAPYHPIIVHFVIALGVIGVAFRLVSLTDFLPWTRPAATALLLMAAVAAVLAVLSGTAAHGPVERIPGVGDAVHEHEEAGEWVRNLLLVLGAIELARLGFLKNEKVARILLYVSGVAGLAVGAAIYRAGDLGGDLVYEYAGGVGIRSGNPEDIQRLLVAGLYNQARVARAAGHPEEAQRLIVELVHQMPNDPAVSLLAVESLLKDRQDPQAALSALAQLQLPEDNPRLAIQKGLMTGQALAASGERDSALMVLKDLKARFPRAERMVDDAIAKLP